MKKSILIICIFTLFQTSIAFAGSPYIRESIGKEEKKELIKKQDKKDLEVNKEKDLFPCRPISSWKGERFIFLPEKKQFQHYGYHHSSYFYEEDGKTEILLNYNEYVGRIAKVVSVDDNNNVKFVMEDNSKILIKKSWLGFNHISCMGLVADIDNARKKWLGKTLLYKSPLPLNTYNDNTGKTGSISMPIGKKTPLKVIDIVAAFIGNNPVRFILKTPSGKEGFVDVNLSGTNLGSCKNKHYDRLDEYFSIKLAKKSEKSSPPTSSSCYRLGYLYGRCATRSMAGLSCEPGTDIVIPESCRGQEETQSGLEAGIKSVN